MKLLKLVLLTISISLGTAYAQNEGGVLIFSLEDCIKYALQNNENVKNTEMDIDIADAQVKEIMADGFPQINGDVGFTHNLSIQTSFIGDFISPVTYEVLFAEGLLEQRALSDTPPLISHRRYWLR